jgi:hypothetical protein
MTKQLNRQKGTALLFAIGITMLLFILGFAFLISSQGDKLVISSVENTADFDSAVNAVIEQINKVLVDDLVGTDGSLLNSDVDPLYPTGTRLLDEPYDYPGPDDSWLACLEPEYRVDSFHGDDYYWRHITDLWGDNFGIPDYAASGGTVPLYYDPDNRSDDNDRDSTKFAQAAKFWVSNTDTTGLAPYRTAAKIIDEDALIEGVLIDINQVNTSGFPNGYTWGGRADADGDGVVDSRWVPIPGLTGPRGETLYAAVRIIDNCAMLNVNTTFRNPEFKRPSVPALATSFPWDGSLLTHINIDTVSVDATKNVQATYSPSAPDGGMIGLRAVSENKSLDDLHEGRTKVRRGLPIYPDDNQYMREVSRRVLNPDLVTSPVNYSLFDFSDELELRNRFFLLSDFTSRLGFIWPSSLDPGTPGAESPYLTGNNAAQTLDNLDKWFHAITSTPTTIRNGGAFGWTPANTNIGNYNRRHLATTYSFDRVMAPKPNAWPSAGMPPDLEAAWNTWTNWNNPDQSLWRFRPIDLNDVTTNAEIERLAAAIWLGLPDETTFNYATDLPQYANLTPSIAIAADIKRHLAYSMAVNAVDYVDVAAAEMPAEISLSSNPLEQYMGFESAVTAQGHLYVSMVAVARWDTDISWDDGGAGQLEEYAIEFYNSGSGNVQLGNWNITVGGTPIPLAGTINAGVSYIVVSDATRFATVDVEDPTLVIADGDQIEVSRTGMTMRSDVLTVDTSAVPNVANPLTWEIFEAPRTPTGSLLRSIVSANNGNLMFPVWGAGPIVWNSVGGLTRFSTAVTVNTAPLQFENQDGLMPVVGEVFNVMGMAAFETATGDLYTLPNLWDSIFQDNSAMSVPPTGVSPTNVNMIDHISSGRIDLEYYDDQGNTDPSDDDSFYSILRYVTVFNPFNDAVDNDGNGKNDDPANDGEDNDEDGTIDAGDPGEAIGSQYEEMTELAVAGRININTAPWFVIAQLPWIQNPAIPNNDPDKFKLAKAIVAYRDKTSDLQNVLFNPPPHNVGPDYSTRWIGAGHDALPASNPPREIVGFSSVGEILKVTNDIDSNGSPLPYETEFDFRRYVRESPATPAPMDYTVDAVDNDLEERDILFQRVSNLATVRSDVFTAYILVRLGEGGPQKRVIAIFDRTKVFTANDTPKLVALHPVPDVN